jgi:hypothetical protein
MRQIVNRMIHFKGQCCVSISMGTHRTRPDFERDPIQLKNLLKVAEQMVYEKFDKRFAESVINPLKKLAEEVDHSNNLDALMLFANENFTESTKLEIPVLDKVVVSTNFLIRDLLFAKQLQYRYYILVLGKEEARLLEAINKRLIKEYKEPFPVKNTRWIPEDVSEKNDGMKSVFLLEDYFNVIDKELNKIVQENDNPVIIATEASNFPRYEKIADHPENIAGYLPLSLVPQEGEKIVQAVWDQVASTIVSKQNVERLQQLEDARSSKTFLADINEIYKAIIEGRGKTLYLKTDFKPDFVLEKNEFVPIQQDVNLTYSTIDPVDTIIRELINLGGEVVFIPEDAETDFHGMTLVTRY